MRQVWAPCVFGCCDVQDHVRHYFDECILWNCVSDTISEFVADIGPRLFGLHLSEPRQILFQILGVAFATQLFVFKSKYPHADNGRLISSLWLSKLFYAPFRHNILKNHYLSTAPS